jgi:hypothetical protein
MKSDMFVIEVERRVCGLQNSYESLCAYKMMNIHQSHLYLKSRNSSFGIALGYGLDDRGSRVRFPAEAGNLSLHRRVQNGSGAHPAPYPMGTRGSFPGGKAEGA